MGSLFESRKILHGLPKVGQKITFIKPTMSWFTNVNEDAEKLTPGELYTVRKTELNSSSTYVWLEEFPNIFDDNDPLDGRDQPFFNMSSFEWDLPEVDPKELIGKFVTDIRMLNRTYGFGIKFKNELIHDGSPTLVVEYDDRDRVTEAHFEL